MEKIKAAIVGLGRIASLLEDDERREKPCTHAGAIRDNPGCTLAAGCDLSEERRRLFAGRWEVPVFSDASEMIRAVNPQILVIATHPDSHLEYCRLANKMLIPVVICEKPLAGTLGDARKIASFAKQSSIAKQSSSRAASQGKTTIIVNHERRYSEDYIKAKSIISSGKLGKLLSVRSVLYMGKTQKLLDVFWHDGTHLVDAIMYLTGMRLKHHRHSGARLTSSAGTAWLEAKLLGSKPSHNNPTPTPVVIEIGAGRDHYDPTPTPVVIEIGAGRDHLVFEIEFSFEKGRLRIGNGIFEIWESGECPYAEKFRSLIKTEENFTEKTALFANMISDAVSCVHDSGRKPLSAAEDGLDVIRYLHSVKAWR